MHLFFSGVETSLIRLSSQALHDRERRGEKSMATTYQGPFLIQFVGAPLSDVCLQASYPGVDATVAIAPIDTSGKTTCSSGSSAATSGSI
jgi:hypothetical protein